MVPVVAAAGVGREGSGATRCEVTKWPRRSGDRPPGQRWGRLGMASFLLYV